MSRHLKTNDHCMSDATPSCPELLPVAYLDSAVQPMHKEASKRKRSVLKVLDWFRSDENNISDKEKKRIAVNHEVNYLVSSHRPCTSMESVCSGNHLKSVIRSEENSAENFFKESVANNTHITVPTTSITVYKNEQNTSEIESGQTPLNEQDNPVNIPPSEFTALSKELNEFTTQELNSEIFDSNIMSRRLKTNDHCMTDATPSCPELLPVAYLDSAGQPMHKEASKRKRLNANNISDKEKKRIAVNHEVNYLVSSHRPCTYMESVCSGNDLKSVIRSEENSAENFSKESVANNTHISVPTTSTTVYKNEQNTSEIESGQTPLNEQDNPVNISPSEFAALWKELNEFTTQELNSEIFEDRTLPVVVPKIVESIAKKLQNRMKFSPKPEQLKLEFSPLKLVGTSNRVEDGKNSKKNIKEQLLHVVRSNKELLKAYEDLEKSCHGCGSITYFAVALWISFLCQKLVQLQINISVDIIHSKREIYQKFLQPCFPIKKKKAFVLFIFNISEILRVKLISSVKSRLPGSIMFSLLQKCTNGKMTFDKSVNKVEEVQLMDGLGLASTLYVMKFMKSLELQSATKNINENDVVTILAAAAPWGLVQHSIKSILNDVQDFEVYKSEGLLPSNFSLESLRFYNSFINLARQPENLKQCLKLLDEGDLEMLQLFHTVYESKVYDWINMLYLVVAKHLSNILVRMISLNEPGAEGDACDVEQPVKNIIWDDIVSASKEIKDYFWKHCVGIANDLVNSEINLIYHLKDDENEARAAADIVLHKYYVNQVL